MIKKLTFVAVALLFTGCANISPNQTLIKSDVNTSSKKIVESVISESNLNEANVGLNRVASKDRVPVNGTSRWDTDRGNFSVSASGKLSDVLDDVSKRTGYRTIMFVDGVDKNKNVSLSINSVSPEYAIRKMAWAAGYIAIIDKKAKSVTVTDQAVYTFKLPSQAFNQLVSTVTSTYSSGSGGSGSENGPIGGGAGTTGGSESKFTINGKNQGASSSGGIGAGGSQGGSGMTTFIKSLVGKNAEVSVSEDLGIISVRSNAVALERLRITLNKMAEVSSRRVAVEATFIEVSLGDTFEYGIDWKRVLTSGGHAFGINGGANQTNNSFNYHYTFGSVASVVTALKKYTDVTVMSQPKIETSNRIPTTFFDGFSIPYLGSVQTVQQQTSTSTSGQVSHADDGVRLSFIPDIVTDSEVQFMLLPVLNSVGAEKTFDLGGGSKLTDFVISKKEALLTVDLEDGQTAIIGGLRSSKTTGDKTGLPGLAKRLAIGNKEEVNAREVVLLLHAKVIPGKPQDVLFSESL